MSVKSRFAKDVQSKKKKGDSCIEGKGLKAQSAKPPKNEKNEELCKNSEGQQKSKKEQKNELRQKTHKQQFNHWYLMAYNHQEEKKFLKAIREYKPIYQWLILFVHALNQIFSSRARSFYY